MRQNKKKMKTLDILIGVTIIFLFCSFSQKKSLPELNWVDVIVRVEENQIVFVYKGALLSYPYTVVDYRLSFDESEDIQNVYLTLFVVRGNRGKGNNIEWRSSDSNEKELIIPREGKLKKDKLHFYYKTNDSCYELKVE